MQLFVAQALTLLAVSLEHIHRRQLAQAHHEIFGAHCHQFLGGLGCTLTALEVLGNDFVQIVDRIQVNVVQLADFRFDITWYGDIHHENRLVLAQLQCAFYRPLAQDRQLTGGGTDDDIALDQFLGNIGQQHRVRTELFSQKACALQGAVGDHDTLDALLMQVAGDQGDGLAGTDQQGLAAGQVTENLLGQADGGKRNRNRVFADGRVGAHLLGRTEGRLKKTPQQRPDGACLACHGIGRLHLAENLRLAQNQRIKAGGDAHHVPHRRIVFVDVGTCTQLVEAKLMVLGQPAQDVVGPQVVLFYVQLTAIAGREDRSFAAVGQAAELLQGLNQLLRGKRHALAHVY
ncbi:hypothetical protein D9M71_236840 [compost metagenome]